MLRNTDPAVVIFGGITTTVMKDGSIFCKLPSLLLNDRSSLARKARLNVPVLQPRTSLSARLERVRPKLKLSFVRALGRAKPMACASGASSPAFAVQGLFRKARGDSHL